jgi:hypothetical protein
LLIILLGFRWVTIDCCIRDLINQPKGHLTDLPPEFGRQFRHGDGVRHTSLRSHTRHEFWRSAS